MDDQYDRDSLEARESTVETPAEQAHKRGLVTGLVVGVIGGAILGGIVVGMFESQTPQTPVATAPDRTVERRDTVWGTADPDLSEGREDERNPRGEEMQDRLEGPGPTPGTQPIPKQE